MGKLRTDSVGIFTFALCVLITGACPGQDKSGRDTADEVASAAELALSILEIAHPGILLVPEESLPRPPAWMGELAKGSPQFTEHDVTSTLAPIPYGDATTLNATGRVQATNEGGWSVEWNGVVSPNDTAFLWSQVEGDSSKFGLSDLYVRGKVSPNSSLKAGRYQPDRLSAVGRLDGFQTETLLNSIFSTGVLAGFRVTDADADADADEAPRPLAVAYLAAEISPVDTLEYSGTVGFLSSGYEGRSDRFAVLVEQNAKLTEYLSLQSNSELDLYMLSDTGGNDMRVTNVNVTAESPLTSFFTLRAGFDHKKTPDVSSERTLAAVDDGAFEEGIWKHWVGGTQKLPWNLELSGELAFEDSYEDDGYDDAWMFALQRKGILFLDNATLATSLFTRDEGDLRGYGGTISGDLPLIHERLSVRPSLTLTFVEPGDRSVQPKATDMSVHAEWRSSRALSLFVGSTYNFVETVTDDQAVAELGMQYYW